MNISKISVNRPVSILMATIIVILLGCVSLSKLSVNLMPDISIPVAVVSTKYPNVGPEEVEKLVTKPIEQAIETTSNIKDVKSMNYEGSSIIIAEFNSGTDMNFATLNMREKIDIVKRFLPEGTENPIIQKVDPNARAIMMVSISGYKDLYKLQNFTKNNIQSKIEKIEGVASANISGGKEKEVTVLLNKEKLEGYKLSIDYISQILRAENINLPAGNINKGTHKLLVRTIGEFKSLEDIENIQVPLKTGGVVYMKDIATIGINDKEQNVVSLDNSKECVSLNIQKQSDCNTVEVCKKVREDLEIIKGIYPNIKINILFDQAQYIEKSINNVKSTAISGAILAILILFIFLKNLKSTFIIGTSIPISIIATFMLMYFGKITINLMTLGGLALGIGMLVDNSIVVLENIYRFIQEGYSRREASIKGTSEVGISVVASTLTTVAVFLPIAFTTGITGEMFKELSLTVVFSLMASLIVSLTFIPMLTSTLLNENQIREKSINNSKKFKGLFNKIENYYKKILVWALKNKKKTIFTGISIFIVGILSLAFIGAEFFPEIDQGSFNINIQLPEGANINDTRDVVNKIKHKAEKIDEISNLFSQIGGGKSISSAKEENKGTIIVTLKPIKQRKRSVKDIMDELRHETLDIPGAKIRFEDIGSNIGRSATPISIDIKGDNIDTLKILGNKVKKIVQSVDGTREVENDLGEGKSEYIIKLNRNISTQYGISVAQISNQIKGTILGKVATSCKLKGENMDIVVKGDDVYKNNISNFKNIQIQTPIGINIPLNILCNIEINKGHNVIKRNNQSRIVTVTAETYRRDLSSISKEIEIKLKDLEIPQGYSCTIGGDKEQMVEAFKELTQALIIAVLLVYMVLAAQFESLINPFVIMFSVPLAFAGGALGLFFTGRSLCVPAFIGIIILSGIVVNNAIVLIDYIGIRRKNGDNREEAILVAGPTRLRPILMTALTTILGLLPMAFGIGDGAEVQAPMATVVIGGLLCSTILTLVYIPVLYVVFDEYKNKYKASYKSKFQ